MSGDSCQPAFRAACCVSDVIPEVVVMGVQTELVFTSSVQGVLKPGDCS